MHSASQRLQAVFGLFTTVLFILCGFVALTSSLFNSYPKAGVSISNVQVKYSRAPNSYRSTQQEYAHVQFSIDADLSTLFHWNTKQVFAYLVAEYSGSKYGTNQVTIWDKIVRTEEEAVFKISNKRNKYAFGEISKSFASKNATYNLYWNVMPQVGYLEWGSASGSVPVPFPARNK